jgi:LPXTG-site transpeptidase (sortase) family protein
VIVVLALLVVVSGTLWWVQRDQPSAGPSDPSDGERVVAGRTVPEATTVPMRPGYPERLVVPALGVDAPIVAILAPGGVLTPPADPQEIGWWADGSRPGATTGSALVTGHTLHTGGGALDDLEDLEVGDPIRVVSAQRRTDYRVRDVEILEKGDLAEQAEQLFDQSVPGRLVVVTCEDWDGREYLSNVVVTAAPVRAG